jgi:hypothetical protein
MVNPITIKHKAPFTSENYVFINTERLLKQAADHGWHPVETKFGRVRRPERDGYQKHQIILEHATGMRDNDAALRIYLLNSHDRTSAFSFNLGFFRFICENGLYVGDSIGQQFKVYHMGRNLEQAVSQQFEQALSFAPKALEVRERMRERILTAEEIQSLDLKFKEVVLKAYPKMQTVNSSLVQAVRRSEFLQHDLWTIYNTAQERIINGRFESVREASSVSGVNILRRSHKTRAITAIDKEAKINKILWDVAVDYVK